MSYNGPSLTETKVTAGGLEVIFKEENNTTEIRSYITDALMKFTYSGTSLTPTKKIQYLFKDHLGSTDTIVTPNGTADDVVKMSFSSFGERRHHDWDNFTSLVPATVGALSDITDKGYTGHQQLDDVGLIHMNGRAYDPVMGRFVSADPHIQAPTDTQSLNRYSYVLNNPLSATDPSGYFDMQLFRQILAIAVTAAIIGPGSSLSEVMIVGAASGTISSGSIKGATNGAFSAAVFYGIGEAFQKIAKANGKAAYEAAIEAGETIESAKKLGSAASILNQSQTATKILSHAIAGGVMTTLNGGKFGHGFASAGVTESLSGAIDGLPNAEIRILGAAIVGGTGSVLTGRKFANGAITGAFSRAFNSEIHLKVGGNGNSFIFEAINYFLDDPIMSNGGAVGVVISYPELDLWSWENGFGFTAEGEFDAGLTLEFDVLGVEVPLPIKGSILKSPTGIGETYIALGTSERSILDMSGLTLGAQGQLGIIGGSIDVDIDDPRLGTTSFEIQFGIGADVGITPTVTTVCSLRHGCTELP